MTRLPTNAEAYRAVLARSKQLEGAGPFKERLLKQLEEDELQGNEKTPLIITSDDLKEVSDLVSWHGGPTSEWKLYGYHLLLWADDSNVEADLTWVKTFFTHRGPHSALWDNGILTWNDRFERLVLNGHPVPMVRTRGQVRVLCNVLGLRVDTAGGT